jgi:large exoprotein involved in heme utilization and adhesion
VNSGNLTVASNGSIATDTLYPGSGNAGNISVTIAGGLTIDGRSQSSFTGISSRSTLGSKGNAGNIEVSAANILIANAGAISTAADGMRSTASGGNIRLDLDDLLYLIGSEITTSVQGETGNGGNIKIDPDLVVLNHSSIIAQAVEGNGGDIAITAGSFIPSTDSIVSATSQLGISGTIVINGPRVDLNGTLVVLSSELRSAVALTRSSCAARATRQSSLTEAGRGGLPQDPEIDLPALYIAGRDLALSKPRPGLMPADASSTAWTTARLTMQCG